MFARYNKISPLDIYFSKLFPVRHCISWQCIDPNCSSKGVFPSTTVQTLVSLPCNNWSLCWSYFRASCCYVLDVHNERTLEDLSRRIYNTAFIVGHLLCGVSVLTLTAISVDRLLALLLEQRHRQVVTLKRTYVIVITFWIVSAAFSAMKWCSDLITIWYSIIGTLVCLVTSIFSYTKIFLTLRLHQNQVQDHVQQPNQTNQLNIARYKKAVSTAIWLQLTLVVCYLPHGVAAFVTSGGPSAPVYNAWYYTVTLVFLNSSLNPILYGWKIKEVRQAVKNTIRQVLCHCFTC